MEVQGNTLAIVLLVVGLVVGAGAGYALSPSASDPYSDAPPINQSGESLMNMWSLGAFTFAFGAFLAAGYSYLQDVNQQGQIEELEERVKKLERNR